MWCEPLLQRRREPAAPQSTSSLRPVSAISARQNHESRVCACAVVQSPARSPAERKKSEKPRRRKRVKRLIENESVLLRVHCPSGEEERWGPTCPSRSRRRCRATKSARSSATGRARCRAGESVRRYVQLQLFSFMRLPCVGGFFLGYAPRVQRARYACYPRARESRDTVAERVLEVFDGGCIGVWI